MAKAKILFITKGFFHPSLVAQQKLKEVLWRPKIYTLLQVQDFSALESPGLREFEAIVLYFHKQKISSQALAGFREYVRSGGGVLALHSVTASFRKYAEFFEVLGGEFRSHHRVQPFAVHRMEKNSLFDVASENFSLRDEVYIHSFLREVDVQFYTQVDGIRIPLVWTTQFGRGRVCYLSPGHKANSFQVPEFAQILSQGLDWVRGKPFAESQ